MNFRFESNIFISAPYVRCDACSQEQFGVFSVGPYTYVRQCRACRHRSDGIPLPALSRKVIYVDQFAISNMMKALNRHHPRHEAAAGDPFWRRLFERLDRLIKLQFAICPYSDVHRLKSMISGRSKAHERMYGLRSPRKLFGVIRRELLTAVRALTARTSPRASVTW